MSAVSDFKEFLLRGNVVDLAVAVVIGQAFGTVIQALIRDIITPIIAAFGGTPDFSSVYFTVNNSRFLIGDFINVLIAFVVIAAVVFFIVVRPVNRLMERYGKSGVADTRECPQCLSAIPIAATRCAFCTSELGAA